MEPLIPFPALRKLLFPLLLIAMVAFSSCRVFYPDLMFKTDSDFQFDKPDTTFPREYTIRNGDHFTMQILSNNGYQLVDILGQSSAYAPFVYVVHSNGFATLPLLDSMKIAGYTVLDLEHILAQRYSYYFLNPFIKVSVPTRHVVVFNGRSSGRIVLLENELNPLIEVIASAGGVTGNKAYRIKVIRGSQTLKNPKVYLFDFSTMESAKQADFLLTNGDIVYVEPSLTLADVNNKILPILGTFSTLILIYTTIKAVGK